MKNFFSTILILFFEKLNILNFGLICQLPYFLYYIHLLISIDLYYNILQNKYLFNLYISESKYFHYMNYIDFSLIFEGNPIIFYIKFFVVFKNPFCSSSFIRIIEE